MIFLVCSNSLSGQEEIPILVDADTAEQALRAWQRNIRAKDEDFRESVMFIQTHDAFSSRFFKGDENTPLHVLEQRVTEFFVERPDLGDLYWHYMQSEDERFLCEELFEFIALHEEDYEHCMCVVEPIVISA